MNRTLVIPIRSFTGMSRLAPVLDAVQRTALARDLATRCVAAGLGAGWPVVVVTADRDVDAFARANGAAVVREDGDGLDAAAATGVASAPGPWAVLHADLPLITDSALTALPSPAGGSVVLVASRDGGTTLIAADGPFRFRFGVGSFHRHLADHPDATVVVDPRLSIDIDTPAHLGAVHAAGHALVPPSTLAP